MVERHFEVFAVTVDSDVGGIVEVDELISFFAWNAGSVEHALVLR